MQRKLYTPKIVERIDTAKEGTIFVPSDFKDIANRETIKMTLSRLCSNKQLRRLLRGVYEKPKYSNFLQEFVEPSPDKIANVISRNYGWSIAPEGDTALNLMGLSTQVPNTWSYVSDGPYKKYQYNNMQIVFKHVTNKEISNISPKSKMTVQAIKSIGEDNINDKTISILKRNLNCEEKMVLLNETKYVSSWIYETIKVIAKESNELNAS